MLPLFPTFVVADASGWPPGTTNFYAVIDRGNSGEEVVEFSGRSGTTLTAATRGADGTSASAHDSGVTIEHCVPALALQEANTHANQTTGTPHGAAYLTSSGNAATATALQTARLIGGVSFDGTANINLPGVNTAGTQDTTGNATTATTATALASTTQATILKVQNDSAQNINDSTVTSLDFISETPVFNLGSFTDSGVQATGWQVPSDGMYRVILKTDFGANATGRRQSVITVNGTNEADTFIRIAASPSSTTSIVNVVVLDLDSGQGVNGSVYHEAGSALNMDAWITIERIGAKSA